MDNSLARIESNRSWIDWVGFKKNCENWIEPNQSNLIGLGLKFGQNRLESTHEHPYPNIYTWGVESHTPYLNLTPSNHFWNH